MNSAIISGATGLIGRWVVAELLKHDIKVYALVRSHEKANTIFLPNKNLHIIVYDFNNYPPIKHFINDTIDVFYHLAWEGVSGEKSGNYVIQLNNIECTLRLVDQLSELGVKKFIGAGSLHELECLKEMKEEKKCVNRGIMYKTAKLSAHYMSKVEVCRQGIQFNWPIITNTFGIGEKTPRLVNSTIRKLIDGESPKFTSGKQLYDFIYITDVAKAFWLIGEKGVNCRNYVLGSGKAKPLKDFLECIGRIIAPDVPLLFGKAPFNGIELPAECYDITSLQEDTGFKCETSFEESIKYMKLWILGGEKDVRV